MATSISASTLKVTIEESIMLNKTQQGGKNTMSISNITDIYKRIIPVPNSEITLYDTHASNVAGSTFDVDNVKYARITNKDNSNYVDLIIKNGENNEYGIRVEAGASHIFFDHTLVMEANSSAITVNAGAQATASLTIADGDDATSGQFTEGEYVKFISAGGTVGIFILSDSAETGAVSSGTVLSSTSDLGTTTPSTSLLSAGTCVAVTMNLNTCTQALLLNELRDTMGASTSPLLNKISGAAGTVPSSNGNQSLVFTQAAYGSAGNTVTTTDISQLTAPDFTGGVNGAVDDLQNISAISAIASVSNVDVEVFVAGI
tara:strand:+ start:552 stop:1502 length:951 start_codon:yes stop_codon:yes gene_type:complete